MYLFARLLPIAVALSLVMACTESQPPAAASAESAVSETPTGPVVLAGNQGRVTNHISVGNYSYIEVENGDARFWIATNPVEVVPGEIIGWRQAALMTNFYSKSLDRTFERILFVGQVSAPAIESGAPPPANRGKVLFVQNAANYSYLEIEPESGGRLWVAVPETAVSVDDRVSWDQGSVMRNFTSNSLNRTFEEIVFAPGVAVEN